MENAPAKLPENFFDDIAGDIQKVIPQNSVTAEALTRIVLTAMNRTPDLRACSKASITAVLFDIASIGLMPNTPRNHCWLIPYRIEGVLQATLQIGYLGFCELAYRTGEVKMIQADLVREGDSFVHEKNVNVPSVLKHSKRIGPGRKDAAILAAWASVELMSGGATIDVMDTDELAKIKRLANSRKESPAWKHFEDEMYKKCVVKRLLKLLQIGSMDTVRRAIEIDNKASNILPGIDVPAKSEHRLILKDAPAEGVTMVDELPPSQVSGGKPEETPSGEKVDPATGEFRW